MLVFTLQCAFFFPGGQCDFGSIYSILQGIVLRSNFFNLQEYMRGNTRCRSLSNAYLATPTWHVFATPTLHGRIICQCYVLDVCIYRRAGGCRTKRVASMYLRG